MAQKSLKAALAQILAQRSHRDYDCAVAFSGGKDSTYVLMRLVMHYGLNVLAITGDDFIASPQAHQNRLRVTDRLGVDYALVQYDEQQYQQLYSAVIKASGMRPRTINLVHNLIHERAVFETLASRNIPIFFTGNTSEEYKQFDGWVDQLGSKGGGGGGETARSYSVEYWRYWEHAYRRVLREVLPQSDWPKIDDLVWHVVDDPPTSIQELTHIPFFQYEPYDVNLIMRIIRDERVGWQMPTDTYGTETDSRGLGFCVRIFIRLHGEKRYAEELDKLVANGSITRAIADNAIERAKDQAVEQEFFDRFGLSWADLHPETCTPFLSRWLDLFLPIR